MRWLSNLTKNVIFFYKYMLIKLGIKLISQSINAMIIIMELIY